MLPGLLDDAALATAAYLLGGMDRAFAMTLDYLKTRQQFGEDRQLPGAAAPRRRPAIQIALARASVESAAATLDAVPGRRPPAPRSAAPRPAPEAAMLVTRQCIQLHGGIGYTDQYDVGLFLRKAMVVAGQFGGAALHRRRFMATAPETEE